MKRIKGTFDGSSVVLDEKVEIPPNTRVEVLIPESQEISLPQLLDELDKLPMGEILTLDEVAALIHEVRKNRS